MNQNAVRVNLVLFDSINIDFGYLDTIHKNRH